MLKRTFKRQIIGAIFISMLFAFAYQAIAWAANGITSIDNVTMQVYYTAPAASNAPSLFFGGN